jgi:long-chain acyl-CoA synthetase
MSTLSREDSLIHLFVDRVRKSGEQEAILVKVDGAFQPVTWRQLAHDVRQTAAGLRQMGVKPGDRVAQFSENSYDWIVCDLGIQMARAIHVPLHAPLSGEQVQEQVEDCGATCIIVGDNRQYARLVTTSGLPASNIRIVTVEKPPHLAGEPRTITLAELQHLADRPEGERIQSEACDHLTPASIATILYTSGTTGAPKGVVLSHRNLVSNTLGTIEAFNLDICELRLCFLPLSHIFARTCDLYTWIARGSRLALAESRETILLDCIRLGPTALNGVPYFYQRVHRYLQEQGKAETPGSLKKALGGEIQLCCSGGAALPDYLYDYFERHEIPLLQGYGLSESSPVITVNSVTASKRSTVGRPIPKVEVRIAEDGEILVRGPNIMIGYWDDPEATQQVIKDGWLHTGDLGSFDSDGFLTITGRKKEIIVTSAGKNIAPTYLEGLLCEDPLIIQAVVLGDGRNYLTALIVPNPDAIRAEVRRLRVLPISKRWVLNHRKIRELYKNVIQNRLACVSHHEQIRNFHLMDRGFTVESGELTPKLSFRRDMIQRNCRDEIEAMYAPRKVPLSSRNWARRLFGRA